ncbi:hypothetical protein [Flagellimonas oceanensis]|uniref:hypothetical protein n=1 Tax=Flagellimonas oceanensis TaxID=2499163 RepID=UPI000F8ECAD2|nr:hypothetical protein [Allomuricauda oceanensis]
MKELKQVSYVKATTCILYGSDEALTLYHESLNALLESDCMDFDVVTFETQLGKKPEFIIDIFEIEGYRIINRTIRNRLHDNLCKKVKKQIIEPRQQKWLEEQEDRNFL